MIPAGSSFNLDAFSIYLTLAAVFIAQATDTPLSFGDLLLVRGVLLITSKGVHGVADSWLDVARNSQSANAGRPSNHIEPAAGFASPAHRRRDQFHQVGIVKSPGRQKRTRFDHIGMAEARADSYRRNSRSGR